MDRTPASSSAIHPLHALFLGCTLPLFLGALLADWAYFATYEVQWINFAAWLIPGALIFAGLALGWAIVDFFRADVRRDRARSLYLLALVATFVLGFINALIHGKDVHATMPAGLILSVLVFILATVSVWLGFSTLRMGVGR